MGTLRFFEEVVSFKIRRTFGFADYIFVLFVIINRKKSRLRASQPEHLERCTEIRFRVRPVTARAISCYRIEFIRILALTRARARMRSTATSLSA